MTKKKDKQPKTTTIDNEAQYLNPDTGEIIEGSEVSKQIKKLIKITNPDSKIKKDTFLRRKDSEHYITCNLGNFYHFIYGMYIEEMEDGTLVNKITELEAKYMVRFFRLCCEMDYDTGDLIKYSKGGRGKVKEYMTRREVQFTLDIGETELKTTLAYLRDKNMISYDKSKFSITEDSIIRGKLKTKKEDNLISGVIRVFIHGYKYIYDNIKPRERKYLFYLFLLLPYINIYYNVICRPEDACKQVYTDIQPLGNMEIRKLFGNDNKTTKKILDFFLRVSVDSSGLIMRITTEGRDEYIINPRFLYAGNNSEYLNIIFDIMNKNKLIKEKEEDIK